MAMVGSPRIMESSSSSAHTALGAMTTMMQTVYTFFALGLTNLVNAGSSMLVVFLMGATASLAAPVQTQGIECPTIDRRAVAALNADDSQIRRMTSGNDVDLANEISGLIGRLKAENPAVSNEAITDILIAAYCPVVAQMANTSPVDKWHLLRKFDRVLMQQISANTTPLGSSIIADVPLPPAVYESLRSQAEASRQTTA
jgi:hypothetical protein